MKYLLTFIMILLVNCNIALANTNDNIVDFSKTGTIEISLNENITETPISGAEINIYQVAIPTSTNHNLAFTYLKDIENCEANLSNLQNQSLPNEISKCINNSNIPSQIKITNEQGIVNFDNLDLGLYLITQTNQVSGYSNITPFLVAIPKEDNNKWIYDIKATPKTEIIKLINLTVEKRWNVTNDNNIPKEVTIGLYKKEELIDTIILNNENDWTYTWKEIEQSDEYKVLEKNIPTGYTATYSQVENKFIVTNTKTLVQTGQNILLIELLSLSGLLFIIIGIIFKKGKNE